MINCRECQTPNPIGEKYCSNCNAPLPSDIRATVPLDRDTRKLESDLKMNAERESEGIPTTDNEVRRTDTQPLQASTDFSPRPPGAVFANQFLMESLIYTSPDQHRYIVSSYAQSEYLAFRACPNPNCGAMSFPEQDFQISYCTDCGTRLDPGASKLILFETTIPISQCTTEAANQKLVHANVRPPLSTFIDRVGGIRRFGVVYPKVNGLPPVQSLERLITWGAGLGRGLDYLHLNGITFEGNIDEGLFGLANEHPVWTNFLDCSVQKKIPNDLRKTDLRALANHLFHWFTGQITSSQNPQLAMSISQVLENALSPEGFDSGEELAVALEQIYQEMPHRISMDLRIGRRTDVGIERSLNEDSLLTMEFNRNVQSTNLPLGVYVVADGMGGHSAGEVASTAIVDAIADKVFQDQLLLRVESESGFGRKEWLKEAVQHVNNAVFDLRKSAGTDMGSTLVMALLEGDTAYIAHVGDSRAYKINQEEITRITTDHSLVERLIATKQITRTEARQHPQRNVVYRTIGDKPNVDEEINVQPLALGDYLLLCSDGLNGMVEDERMHEIVINSPDPQTACNNLIDAANAAGGEDNITAILVQLIPA